VLAAFPRELFKNGSRAKSVGPEEVNSESTDLKNVFPHCANMPQQVCPRHRQDFAFPEPSSPKLRTYFHTVYVNSHVRQIANNVCQIARDTHEMSQGSALP
jgi:hypothetical protein